MHISSQATETIKSSLDGCTSNPESGIPGLVFVSVDKSGKALAAHASGKRAPNSTDPMTLDTVFWIASCTKMITGLACMQLVEQGKLSLDDSSQVYKLCPEIEKAKVLQDGKLVDRKGDITLRMLLSHKAGFGYEFFNKRLMDFGRAGGVGVKGAGFDVFSGDEKNILRQPLVNQPGTAWEYGVSLRSPHKALETKQNVDQPRLGWYNRRTHQWSLPQRLLPKEYIPTLRSSKYILLPKRSHAF
jgi:hypothetical protein